MEKETCWDFWTVVFLHTLSYIIFWRSHVGSRQAGRQVGTMMTRKNSVTMRESNDEIDHKNVVTI